MVFLASQAPKRVLSRGAGLFWRELFVGDPGWSSPSAAQTSNGKHGRCRREGSPGTEACWKINRVKTKQLLLSKRDRAGAGRQGR